MVLTRLIKPTAGSRQADNAGLVLRFPHERIEESHGQKVFAVGTQALENVHQGGPGDR